MVGFIVRNGSKSPRLDGSLSGNHKPSVSPKNNGMSVSFGNNGVSPRNNKTGVSPRNNRL